MVFHPILKSWWILSRNLTSFISGIFLKLTSYHSSVSHPRFLLFCKTFALFSDQHAKKDPRSSKNPNFEVNQHLRNVFVNIMYIRIAAGVITLSLLNRTCTCPVLFTDSIFVRGSFLACECINFLFDLPRSLPVSYLDLLMFKPLWLNWVSQDRTKTDILTITARTNIMSWFEFHMCLKKPHRVHLKCS